MLLPQLARRTREPNVSFPRRRDANVPRSPSLPRTGLSARLALLGVPAVLASLVAIAGIPGRDTRVRDLRPTPAATAPVVESPRPAPAPEAPSRPAPPAGDELRALDARPAEVAPQEQRSGELDETALKKIAKLEAKIAKKQLLAAKKQAQLLTTQGELALAQSQLLAALLLPEGTPEELAAKLKAIKKATNLVNKKLKKIQATLKKIATLEASVAAFEDQIEGLDDGGGEDPDDPAPTAAVDVPLLVQQVLPAGVGGVAWTAAEASFGIPFAEGEVPEVNGRPALAVVNSEAWQFRTLDTWPDGSVQWALVDAVTDVPAGGVSSELSIIGGAGKSEGADVASDDGNAITLDTGLVVAKVLKAGFNLFDTVQVDGVDIVAPHQSAGLIGLDADGLLVVPRPSSVQVVLEENGPARAVVRATGTLASMSGDDIVDFTCRITARRSSADLQVDLTVRNANLARPQHAVLNGLGLVVRMLPGANAKGLLARHDGQQTVPLTAPGSHAWLRQAYSSASTTDVTGSGTNYKPPIPKLTSNTFAEEGYQLSVNDVDVWSLGDKTKYPPQGWVDLSGDTGGVTLSQRRMAYSWPSCLEVYANGDVVAGLWTTRNVAPYVFCWRQHESRTVSFSFHRGQASTPAQAAVRLDRPIAGRAADYDQYDAAGVFPYRLLTKAEQNEAYALMGVQHTIALNNDAVSVTRFLAAHNTGGSNNHDSIERRLGGEWLRDGLGGQYINALDLALYKAEWQILRSDNFDDANAPSAATNDATVSHSDQYQGDLEHRYRDGMILAWWLTGDERLRDALLDEEEILAHLANTAQERSLYQTLRAIALIGRFTDSERLRAELHEKLDYVLTPVLDVNSGANGFGWQAAPGLGDRRYFVNSSQNTAEKPVGENYVTRGFITASLGPLGYFHAWKWLGLEDADAQVARQRATDLAFFTRKELFPHFDNPADRHLVYSWSVKTQQVNEWETSDFHPILLGMAEAFRHTGDATYLVKGIEQIQAFKAHDQGPYSDNLYLLDSRLDVQHFLAIYRDYMLGVIPD